MARVKVIGWLGWQSSTLYNEQPLCIYIYKIFGFYKLEIPIFIHIYIHDPGHTRTVSYTTKITWFTPSGIINVPLPSTPHAFFFFFFHDYFFIFYFYVTTESFSLTLFSLCVSFTSRPWKQNIWAYFIELDWFVGKQKKKKQSDIAYSLSVHLSRSQFTKIIWKTNWKITVAGLNHLLPISFFTR